MQTKQISVELLFDGVKLRPRQTLVIENGFIASIEEGIAENTTCLKGILTAGFIDIQVNGGGGLLFNQAPTLETLQRIGSAHEKFGTTAWLATFITDDFEKMLLAADAVSQAIEQKTAGVIGIHFEGPHISKIKKGVHKEPYIRPLSNQEKNLYYRKDLGQVVVTLAPEMVDCEDIKQLVKAGVMVCLGHSNCSYAEAAAAISAGASCFTHLFNAMSPLGSREPGMVAAALLHPDTFYGLIVDGIHVDAVSAKLALQNNKNLILVTDAMPPVGSQKKSFQFFDENIKVENNRLIDASARLAGSLLTMNDAVKNSIQLLQATPELAFNFASLNAAKFLAMDNLMGNLSPGKKANMVLLDSAYNIRSSWRDGKQLF